jgi:hypothetical protein
MRNRHLALPVICAALSLWIPSNAQALQSPEAVKLVLTSEENGLENQSEFYCSGRIHGYLRLPGPVSGKHTLEGVWTAADGKVIDHSHVAIDFPPPGESMAYIWLEFPSKSFLGNLNPTGDLERLSYNGTWQVEAKLDDQTLLTRKFSVHCD